MKTGQRVWISPEHSISNGVPVDEPFEVAEVRRRDYGDDAFCRLRDRRGRVLPRWTRATELLASKPKLDPGEAPRTVETEKERRMSNETNEQKLISLSKTIAAEQRIDLASATKLAGAKLEQEATAWREGIREETPASEPVSGQGAFTEAVARTARERKLSPTDAVEFVLRERFMSARSVSDSSQPVVSLRAGESFDDLAQRIANERKIGLRQAIHLAGQIAPALAAER
jgi:hypothetical protein